MSTILAGLVVALMALPVLAGQPTPTPVAKQQQKAQKGRVLQQQGKEVQSTATPTSEPVGAITFGRDNMTSREAMTPTPSVEGKPTKDQRQEQPRPTPAPAESINLNSSRSNIYRVVQPTVTPTAEPVESSNLNSSRSNTFRVIQTTPTQAPAESINLNSSRSNIYRAVQPTVTPTKSPKKKNSGHATEK